MNRALRSGCVAAALVATSGPARADDDRPDLPEATTQPSALPATTELTEAELLRMAEAGETVEIFDERPDKPFDRDTEVRLTGEQLAARGAVDLGTALALLPDVQVRDAGRGGFNIDIRGGRKGAVAILVDGVMVNDPYYGTFDVSTIPITDIVQIRVATTPQSPIDGPGGTAGVIEVITRDAFGSQLVVARLTGSTLQAFGMTGTTRVPLAKRLALRLSASGNAGARDFELPMTTSIDEGRRAATGALRLEYRDGDRRLVVDGSADDRSYLAPPNDLGTNFLLVDRETTYRAQAKFDDKLGRLQLQAQGWAFSLDRASRNFNNVDLENQRSSEELSATRVGGMVLATRPFARDFRWATSATLDHQEATVVESGGDVSGGEVTVLQLAVDGQYERRRFRIDAAAGLAIPIGFGADPWPEGKLVAKYKPLTHLELTATTGYKGRVPSLRERFDISTGNPDLQPENAFHAEVRAIEQRDGIRLEVAPFYRQTHGTVRVSTDPADMMRLTNLGELDIYGVDLQGRVSVHAMIEVGGSYNYIRAKSDTSDDPLDRLPRHRADAWVQATPLAKLSALARVRYAGEAIESGMITDAHFLVEGTLTAALSRAYLAVVRVEDALDEAPATRSGFTTAGRVVSVVLQGTWE